jgi:hypothetical protein
VGLPTPGRVENPLWARWTWAVRLSLAGAVAAGAVAVAALALLEPRLLTWEEIVPPDESLVTALLAPVLLLSSTAVLAGRRRRVPAALQLTERGIAPVDPAGRVGKETPWAAVELPLRPAAVWEGVPVILGRDTGRPIPWWLDAALVDRLRLRRPAPDAPSGAVGPAR